MRMRLLACLFCLTLCLPTYETRAAEKPNIIVIMADDLGYGDVGCYGAKPESVKTPHIDKLAAEGLRFTSGYCSASTCTPTRYTLLTGTYAFRKPGTGIAPPNGSALVRPEDVTIADLMKKAGYATAVVGKWHLGLGDPPKPDWNGKVAPGPLEIGFDYSFLLPTTNDRVPQVYLDGHHVVNLDPKDPLWVSRKNEDGQKTARDPEVRKTLKMDWSHGHNSTVHNGIGRIGFYGGGHAARWRDEDLTDKWVEKSNAWIEKNKDGPFFLFYASHAIHVPRMPHERFQGKSGMSYRGDAIVELDWSVGQIMKKLDELGIADNTLIVFCSDNGPVLDDGYKDGAVTQLGDHKPAGPYRGGKYSIYEGGTRTPFITHWPGRIKPGVSEKMVCTVDLASSLAALTGVDVPDDACLDSFNVLPALLGDADAKGRDHLVQQPNRGPRLALRVGDWKLLDHGGNKPYSGRTFKKSGKAKYSLYNLADDPGEKNDLAQKDPKKLEELRTMLEKIKKDGRTRH